MITSNSSVDWTKFMDNEEKSEFVKDPDFKNWLIELLSEEKPTIVTFTKKDGDIRIMKCTRNLELIPTEFHPKNKSSENATSLAAFDVNKQEWRSFIVENVTRIEFSL